MLRKLLVVVVAGLSVVGLGATRLTIPELIRRVDQDPIVMERLIEFVPMPFNALVSKSDMIVYGAVTATNTYLSDDQYELYTDYSLVPMAVLKESLTDQQWAAQGNTIVVKRWGGKLTIDGRRVEFQDRDVTPIDTKEVLLFLEKDPDGSKYRVVHGLAGVMAVRDGQLVVPSRNWGNDWLNGKSLSEVYSEVRRITRR